MHVSLKPVTDIVTPLTVIINIILVATVIYRDYFSRYTWLTYLAAFSVLSDSILYRIRIFDHGTYDIALTCVQFAYVFFNLLIIFTTEDRRITFPVEFQLGIEFIAFLAKKAQFLWFNYYLRCGLAIANLLMLGYFIYIIWRHHEQAPRARGRLRRSETD